MLGLGSSRDRIIAVADVGSGSAGFSILASHPGKPATILAASRSILPLEERSREQTATGVLRMLAEAGKKVSEAYGQSPAGKQKGPPSEIYAVVRAPWTHATAGRGSSKFEQDTAITEELIMAAAQSSFSEKNDLDRSNLLETSVIRVELNEYPTSEPIGKKAHRLDVVTFQSDCEPTIKSGITSTLESLFPGRQIALRSGARTYLSIVQEKMEHPEAYVIIDMVSEATTIMAVRDGVITHHGVIQEGVRTILRRITGAKGTPEEVIGLMRMVVAGSCSATECERLNEALSRVEPELVRVFGEAVGKLLGTRRLPDTLVLFAHPDVTAWLSHVFSRIDFAQFTIPLRPFSIKLLTNEKLKSMVEVGNGVQADNGILVASAFVDM